MDKGQALYQFWSGFGLPAYERNTVPADAEMPYITYEASEDALDTDVVLSASIYYRSLSWKEISKKADEIARYITMQRRPIPLDQGGFLWITRGTPFIQNMSDEDPNVRRKYINYIAEFLTAY